MTVLDQDFGIEVNHVVSFNFDTFQAVAEAVGGVEQYFPTPARDQFSLRDVPSPGCVNLNGARALAFVRSREYQYFLDGSWHYQLFPESDLARIQRQHAFAGTPTVDPASSSIYHGAYIPPGLHPGQVPGTCGQ